MGMRFRNLFFDLDDTLWAFTENARDTFAEVYRMHRLDRYFESFGHFYTLYNKMNRLLWKQYEEGRINKKELNSRRFLYPLEAVGVADSQLAEAYSASFFERIPLKEKLVPGASETLAYLREKGYRLFILSNGFRNLQFRKMHSAGIEGFFDRVILSEDLGVLKPNPALFHFALSATQSALGDSLMIGDSWEADMVGAKKAGMAQAYYNPSGWGPLSFRPTFEMASLAELQFLL